MMKNSEKNMIIINIDRLAVRTLLKLRRCTFDELAHHRSIEACTMNEDDNADRRVPK
jgi:hypothetical protein